MEFGEEKALLAKRKQGIEKTEKGAESVNIGKVVEKIATTLQGFPAAPADCRSLFEPIDFMVFDGLVKTGRVDVIRFVEVKSGAAKYDEKEQALREKALAAGQKAARKRLKRIAGPFVRRKIDPQDVKVLFDPIEFVAFRGMCDGGVKAVSLIDRPAANKERQKVQDSVSRAVEKGNYEWQELRIDGEGRVGET